VLAVIEYNYEHEGEIIVPAGAKNVLEKSDRAVSRANRSSSQLRSFCLVIHFTDGVDQGLRLIKLDVFRAIVGEDLFRIGR
jgi:hypothetical protein